MRILSLLCLVGFAFPCRVFSQPVGVSCWIVGTGQGGSPKALGSVSNDVQELNRVFRQVAMSFVVESIVQTNDTRLSNVLYNDDSRTDELCGIAAGVAGLKLFYVSSIDEATAFSYRDDCIILGPGSNERTLAHEMGHLCGLQDIYDWSVDTTLRVEGPSAKTGCPTTGGIIRLQMITPQLFAGCSCMGTRLRTRRTFHMETCMAYGVRRLIVWIPGQMFPRRFGIFRPLRLAFISAVNALCHDVA